MVRKKDKVENFDLEKFKEETKEEISHLEYRKYLYQYSEDEKLMFIDELKKTEVFFRSLFNMRIYPVYGTLLGIIRNNDFIPYDTDMDMAYLSNCHTAKEVTEEYYRLCSDLHRFDMLLKNFKPISHFHCWSPSKKMRFDMWISWFDTNGKYYLTWIFDGEFDKQLILPFKTIKFKNQDFTIINNPEQFLTYYYGDWKTPTLTNWTKRKQVFRLGP
jgi:hypothetical protein